MKPHHPTPHTPPAARLSLASACLLVALVVVPTWSNPASSFGFEPDKTWLLILLMSIGLGARLIGRPAPASGRRLIAALDERLRRDPLSLAPLPILAAALLSTLCAIGPTWAWYGSPQRAGGFFSLAALAIAFWLARDCLRQAGGPAALSESIALSSLPVLLVALWQHAGWPLPSPWAGDGFAGRIFATLGNPDFLASYLALTLPLTIAGAVGALWPPAARPAVDAGRSGRSASSGGAANIGRAISLGALALGQGLALMATRSRAGWLGGLAALLLLGLIVALRRHWRAPAVLAALALLGMLLGVAPLMLVTHADGDARGPAWGTALDPTGSGRQRLGLWSETLNYLTAGSASAGQWLVGGGPDTAGLIMPNQIAYRPRQKAQRDAPAYSFDRAHNLILDTLLMQGFLGVVAAAALVIAAGRAGLRCVGRAASWRAVGFALAAGIAASAAVSSLAAALLGDIGLVWAALPVTVGLGLAAGWCGLFAWRGWRAAPEDAGPAPLALAALAGLFGHWVEMQFSFATPAASLLVWVYLACLLSAPAPWPIERPAGAGRRMALFSGAMLLAGLLPAALVETPLPTALLATLWIGAGALAFVWAGVEVLKIYPLLSLGPALAFWLAMQMLPASAPRALWATGLGWAIVLACAGALAWAGQAKRRGQRALPFRPMRAAQLTAGGLLVVAGLISAARMAAGDMLTLDGLRLARGGDLDASESRLAAALSWGVHDTLIYDALSQLYMTRSTGAGDLTARHAWLERAAQAAGAAWAATPQQIEFGRRQALIYEEWAEATPERAGRAERLTQARDILERARDLAPADPRPPADLAHINQLLAESK
jgi:hypothetical protein